MIHTIRLIVVAALLLSINVKAQVAYFPPLLGATWDTLSPQRFAYQPNRIDSLYSFLEQKNTKAFLLLRDGKIVLERYFGAFTRDSLWQWASAGKTITSMAIGIAQQDRRLSIDATSSSIMGNGWTSEPLAKEQLITVRNQLTMTSGLDDGVPESACTTPACLLYKADAGTRWAYHNAPYTLLDSVIERSTGQSLNQFVGQRIRNRIGMGGQFVKVHYDNVYFSTPRGMARFGLLMLNRGTWKTTPVLTDTAYYRQMVNSSNPLNLSYGYLWWLNGKASYRQPGTQFITQGPLTPNAPADMHSAMGKDGQLLCVVPSKKMVVVRMGKRPDLSNGAAVSIGFANDMWKYIRLLTGTVRVQPVSQSVAPRVWPNPTSGKLTLDGICGIATLHDLEGRKCLTISGNEADLTDLPNGVYYLTQTNGHRLQVIKW